MNIGVFCAPCRVEGNALTFADGAAEVLQVQVQILHCLLHMTLQWRHNGRDGVSNHQHHDCLLNRLFRCRSKENIKAPRHWPFSGEFTSDRWIPAQMASNAENVSIWWRHHDKAYIEVYAINRNTHTWKLFLSHFAPQYPQLTMPFRSTTIFTLSHLLPLSLANLPQKTHH